MVAIASALTGGIKVEREKRSKRSVKGMGGWTNSSEGKLRSCKEGV